MNFNLEKYQSIGGIVKNGTPRSHIGRHDLLSQCRDRESPVSALLKDKTAYKCIKEGNASDPVLKRDAAQYQTQFDRSKKAESKRKAYQKVLDKREQYKKRYKENPL